MIVTSNAEQTSGSADPGKPWYASARYASWFAADTAGAVGVSLRTLALSLIGYAVSGSLTRAGWLATASLLAQQGMGVVGGTYVDRHDRKRLIIVNAFVGFLAWGSIAMLGLYGMLRFTNLLVIAVLASAVNGLLGSAADAMLRSIIDIRDYPWARSVNEGRDAVVNMAGGPVGGFLYAVRPWLPFLVSSVAHMVSGVAACRIRESHTAGEVTGDGADAGADEGAEAGCMVVGSVPVGRSMCVAFAFICAVVVPMTLGDGYALILISNSLVGLPFPLINALLLGFVFAKAPERMQGRIASSLTAPAQALSAFCGACAGGLITAVGFRVAVVFFLAMLVVGALIVLLSPSIRAIPRAAAWSEVAL